MRERLNSKLVPPNTPVVSIEHVDFESGSGKRIKLELEPRSYGIVIAVRDVPSNEQLGEIFVENFKQDVTQTRVHVWPKGTETPTTTELK